MPSNTVTRQCKKCKAWKQRSRFSPNKYAKSRLHNWCKPCRTNANTEYYWRNREKIRAQCKKYYKKNRDYIRAKDFEYKNQPKVKEHKRKMDLVWNYGVGAAEFYSERIISQNGLCAICMKKPQKKSLFLDHDHRTNKFRGLLCMKCNMALGLLSDDPILVSRALEYLKQC